VVSGWWLVGKVTTNNQHPTTNIQQLGELAQLVERCDRTAEVRDSSSLFSIQYLAWEYLQNTCSKLSGGALAMQTPYLTKLPIPKASTTDRNAISQLVQKCLDAKGVGCEAWEKEINERVAALYGL
jgi:hypothetical protein